MLSKIKWIFVMLGLCFASTHNTQAAILISNIEFSDFSATDPNIATSLSFELEGTIENVVGANSSQALFIGETGNNGWIQSSASGTWTSNPSFVLPANAQVNAETVNGGAEGDRVSIGLTGGAFSFEYQQNISGTFSVSNGSFIPSATDTSQWIVSVGFNDFIFPDPTAKTGSAVPEPSALAVLVLGGALISLRRRPWTRPSIA